MATLRERRRRELHESIMTAARHRLETEGVEGLVLRAIARDLGMAVSALYRYVASRDDLITELLVETFEQHADAVEAAVDEALGGDGPGTDVGAAFAAGLMAYRDWAVRNPARFGLAYGAPVPGYQAPPERTVAAATRPGDRMMGLLGRAYQDGLLDAGTLARRAADLDPQVAADLEDLRRRRAYAAPLGAVALATDIFVRVHGLTVMEVFGQLRPLVRHSEPYVRGVVDDAVAGLGLRPRR